MSNASHALTRKNSHYRIAGRFILISGTLVILVALAACGALSTPAPSPAPPADKLAEIMARGTLVIATDDDYPPQSELTGAPRADKTRCASIEHTASEFTGFDVEVAVELARRLGVEPCFVTPTWTQMTGGSWNDRWDISISSMAITPERVDVLYLSQPYYTTPAAFFVHQDNTTFSKPSDLSGHTIGVCADCTYESYLEGTLDIPGEAIDFAVKDAKIVAYDTEAPSMKDLAEGDGVKLDAILTNTPTGQGAIKKGLPLKQLDGPVFYEYLAAAIDKKHSKDPLSFARKVSETIQGMHRDGVLLKLSEKYYGEDLTTAASQYNIQGLKQLP